MERLIYNIFLLGLLVIIPNYTLLASGEPKSAREQVQEANIQLAGITRTVKLAEQVKDILSCDPEEHPQYKDIQKQWESTVGKILEAALIPSLTQIISDYACPHWYESTPYNLYNYDSPFSPAIMSLSDSFQTFVSYLRCKHNRRQVLQQDESIRNTTEFWKKFLEQDKKLYLKSIENNQNHWQKKLKQSQQTRNRQLYEYQNELIKRHNAKDALIFFGTLLGSLFTEQAAKRMSPETDSSVFMKRLSDSLIRTFYVTFFMQAVYQPHKLQTNDAIVRPQSLVDAKDPVDIVFPKLHLLNNMKFVPLYTLLDLLHTYGLEYKSKVIESKRWHEIVHKIEQWLKSKINHYNSRKKRLARIAQKLKLPVLLSTVPFITKLFLAAYPSHTCIDVEPLKNTAS